MFFKGTQRRPTARTISTEIDAIGGEFNAFTGKELTGYYVRCGSETRDTALDVLADMDDPAYIQQIAAFAKTHSRMEFLSYFNSKPGSLWDLASKPRSRDAYRKLITPLGR